MIQVESADQFLKQVSGSVAEGERIRLCLQCGSCSGVCPFGFAMEFPPQAIIASLRAGELKPMLDTDSIWLCVSCYACTNVCPAKIPLTPGLLSSVKAEKLMKSSVPTELQDALVNARKYGNTVGESPRKRADWAADFTVEVPILAKTKKPVDVLWYVGDYPSYHARVQQVTRATAKIFKALGVSFGILGPEEQSDGDVFHLAGERGLFELLASKNAKTFEKYEFKEIVTTDPHAYNTFKHEYPKLGYRFPVRHYAQFLHAHLDRLRSLMKNKLEARVAYHDPCGLGRANDNHIYEEPREIIEAIPGAELVEMGHNRTTSICCGGGGGGMWLDGFAWEKAGTRTSEWRIHEAVAAGAQILAVACPYETPRFDDAVKSTNHAKDIAVKDIAELVADAIQG
ncbi:MAG: (Fe-S)-binding protein [Candidatus Eisenbacteria bacterium]|nr:(Fe-S)-binding protein [Candidatus Eisenbacteria bacterium]